MLQYLHADPQDVARLVGVRADTVVRSSAQRA
jgi:hypothetical protein